MTAFIVSALFFALIYGSAAALWAMRKSRGRSIEERFAELQREVQFETTFGSRRSLGQRLFEFAMRSVPAPDPESAGAEKLGQELVRAGITRAGDAAARFYTLRALLAVAAGVAGVVFGIAYGKTRLDVVVAALCASGFSVVGLHYYVKRRARVRQAAIASELSEALDLLVVAVESGMGLNEALRIVGAEAERQDQVIGRELAIVSAEISAGKTMGDALRSLADRTAVADLKPLAATLIQSEQLGSQIGPALRASSDALREARKLRAEEMAQKLAIKILFPLVTLVLPAMLALVLGPAMLQIVRALGK